MPGAGRQCPHGDHGNHQMRQTVDEKLQGTLEKRLGESFKLVSGAEPQGQVRPTGAQRD